MPISWILGIQWVDKVTNVELWRRSQQEPVNAIIKKKNGDMYRTHPQKINHRHKRQALGWKPAGKRRRGSPKKFITKVSRERS